MTSVKHETGQIMRNNSRSTFTFIDLFAGIGGMRLALTRAGGRCVFSSEIDRFAAETYECNFGTRPAGDIREITADLIPEHDCLVAGFPCQPFSHAGLKRGFDDTRGTLFFEIQRVLEHHRPRILLLENVKGFVGHDQGRTYSTVKQVLEQIGYRVHSKVLNASDFGLPQNRERIFIVGLRDDVLGDHEFSFPAPPRTITRLGDILERGRLPDRYYISDKLWRSHKKRLIEHRRKGNGFGYRIFTRDSTRTSTLSARYYKDGSEILIETTRNPRRLTPREAARLQGFPDDFVIPVSDTQAYKQFGNSVAIPVVEAIAHDLAKALNKSR
jgi:DNA (cytosine-5)-methyltransferase 1